MSKQGSVYRYYILFVLTVVYIFNFIDRQILSILAEDIKVDLGISDAEIGFLYGTAFALFYALFGIPLARFADLSSRTKLISAGMAFWSLMTAASGFSRNLFSLAIFRFGVGIGEASASPAANSLLSDYFPSKMRGTALAIYSSGSYIGAGLGVFIGGAIVSAWSGWYPDPQNAPLGLAGWQAAFLGVGLPGLAAAMWTATLKEPSRGTLDGTPTQNSERPFRAAWTEMACIVPPLTLIGLRLAGGTFRDFTINLFMAMTLALVAIWLSGISENPAQWITVAIGLYGVASWAQSLALRQPEMFEIFFRTPTVPFLIAGFASMSIVSYGVGFWYPSYFIRTFGVSASEVGMTYGLCVVVGGFLGVTLAGIAADLLYARFKSGRLIVALASIIATVPFTIFAVETSTLSTAYICAFGFCLFAPMWLGICFSSLVDLVRPDLRATLIAVSILANTLIGLAIGPSLIGQISDVLIGGGVDSGAALGTAMQWSMSFAILAAILIYVAIPRMPTLARSDGSHVDGSEVA